MISDYPLQSDERNQTRYQAFAGEFSDHGTFRLADGAVVRHHRIEWFSELLSAFSISEIVELDAKTMNGNRAQIAQIWAKKPPALQCAG